MDIGTFEDAKKTKDICQKGKTSKKHIFRRMVGYYTLYNRFSVIYNIFDVVHLI